MCAKVKHAIFSKKKLDFRGGGGVIFLSRY